LLEKKMIFGQRLFPLGKVILLEKIGFPNTALMGLGLERRQPYAHGQIIIIAQ
jgi:hypothetical protein